MAAQTVHGDIPKTSNYTAAPPSLPRARMCLILFAYRVTPEAPLIVAANRDEFYDRPAQCAHFWPDVPGLLAGRDQTAGGTWLGISRQGRFAAVTNFAVTGLGAHSTAEQDEATKPAPVSPAKQDEATIPARDSPVDSGGKPPARSRGALTSDFLRGAATATEYARQLRGTDYQGFNLLLFDGAELVCTSNRGVTRSLESGYYGLTNAQLGAAWPKVVDGTDRLRQAVEDGPTVDALIGLLRDGTVPPDERLPHRGRPLEWERRVAPCFIVGDDYGTRASTAVIFGLEDVLLTERSYASGGRPGERVDFRVSVS